MKYLALSLPRDNSLLQLSFQIIFKILSSTDKNQPVAIMSPKNQKIQYIAKRFKPKKNNMLRNFNSSQVIYQIKVRHLKTNGLLI